MNIETVSYLKKNAASLPLNEPLIITQNGKPAYVIESIEDREKRDEAIALLKLVSFARNDKQAGRVISSSSFKERLAKRKLNLQGAKAHEPSHN
ncbi:type II toxin-antitoxin system Phd/YefM family antitoxin [Psychromonas sp. Urea-02u-13]|uniref:type II toxin-antitoxin system Phd/YefM family antitoxin n=1 Tax=Psychromonas sp. Urea-02u-13 TaxID=2058326 RepID=UPI000C31C024|nr:type II toxin-antitoxin system Phd/YefM family antitoxin [Psychromonas sp. Urea-02u-13]PKG36999.1 prevent-host-death protein [Psychromonas sp. Urea-02u-13]